MTNPDLGQTPIDSTSANHAGPALEFSAIGPTGAVCAHQAAPVETMEVKMATAPKHETARRLLSLDALRGLTIAFMIMVNNNGGAGSWRQMNHAFWNGLTATDLVFPTFLFVVGVSIVFAFEARLVRGVTRAQLRRHTLVRAVWLILFGIVVNNFPLFALPHMRFYGVLQRIALCYLAVSFFYLWDSRVSTKVAVLVALLIGYWTLLRWVPVPGAGVPGRDIPFLDHYQNIVAWLDRHLMPGHLNREHWMPGHLNKDYPAYNIYDPEGLLSTFPAIGTTLIGLIVGISLRARRSPALKSAGLVAGSLVCLALGYFWSNWFPLNKRLWTSSYVLAAAGWSLAAFALFYFVVEQKGWCRSGRSRALVWPWLVFGSNAITAYMISELLPNALRYVHFGRDGLMMNPISWAQLRIFSHIPDPGWAAFAYCLTFTLICFVPVWVLYRKKIFLKI